VALVEILAPRADWSLSRDAASGMSMAPLHIAASEGKRSLVDYLVRKRAPTNLKAYWKRTPIHLAVVGTGEDKSGTVSEDRFACLSMLISAKGSDVNPRDIDGESPLSLAVKRGAWRTARILLSAGADPCSHGRYPSVLARAIDGGSNEIANMILRSNPECAP